MWKAFRGFASFTITNGFVAGVNQLEFVVTNGTSSVTALRAEPRGVGLPRPVGAPVIASQPQPRTVRDGGKTSLSVVGLGNPALAFQWFRNGTAVSNATNRTFHLEPVSAAQTGDYTVAVRNTSGSVTSQVARVTLVLTNQPPVAVNDNLATALDQALTFQISSLLRNDSDPDGYAISFVAADAASVSGGSIIQDGGVLTYTPAAGFSGADRFNYTMTDELGASITAQVTVQVGSVSVPLTIGSATNNRLRLSWPASASGFVLQVASALPGNFTDAGLSTTTEGTDTVVTVSPTETVRFYRLIRR